MSKKIKEILSIKVVKKNDEEIHYFLGMPIWRILHLRTRTKIYFCSIQVLVFENQKNYIDKPIHIATDQSLAKQMIMIKSFNLICQRRNCNYMNKRG